MNLIKKLQTILITGSITVMILSCGLTGDMNAAPGSKSIDVYQSFLTDSKDVSEVAHAGPVGTFNRGEFNFISKTPIDYIFLNNQFSVKTHRTIDDSENGLYTSDHFPIISRLLQK